ncbi:hypothetical protein ACFY0N_39015 [Streptomyces vinaceus]|uniref:hypothetical protein n=1 Tax=Streptomyces vinaceus TaxID=1960 RepID=UPI0035DEC7A3
MLGEQELDAPVEFRSFGFQESDDAVVPVPFPNESSWGVILQGHVRRFDVFSAGHTHTAAVKARIWDGAPEAEGGHWDEKEEIDYESVSDDAAGGAVAVPRTCTCAARECLDHLSVTPPPPTPLRRPVRQQRLDAWRERPDGTASAVAGRAWSRLRAEQRTMPHQLPSQCHHWPLAMENGFTHASVTESALMESEGGRRLSLIDAVVDTGSFWGSTRARRSGSNAGETRT